MFSSRNDNRKKRKNRNSYENVCAVFVSTGFIVIVKLTIHKHSSFLLLYRIHWFQNSDWYYLKFRLVIWLLYFHTFLFPFLFHNVDFSLFHLRYIRCFFVVVVVQIWSGWSFVFDVNQDFCFHAICFSFFFYSLYSLLHCVHYNRFIHRFAEGYSRFWLFLFLSFFSSAWFTSNAHTHIIIIIIVIILILDFLCMQIICLFFRLFDVFHCVIWLDLFIIIVVFWK